MEQFSYHFARPCTIETMGGASSVSTQNVSKAYQVTTVMESSPGAVCGLHEKEDFILAMDDRELLGVALNDIGEIVKEHENKPLILTVFNAQTKVIREVTLVPTSDWPGEGLLGIKLKLTVYEKPIDELNDAADFRSRSKSADTGDAHPEIDGKKPTGRSSFSLA